MKLRYSLIVTLCSTLCAAPLFAETAPEQANEEPQVLMKVNEFEVTPDVFQAFRGLRQGAEPRGPQQAAPPDQSPENCGIAPSTWPARKGSAMARRAIRRASARRPAASNSEIH